MPNSRGRQNVRIEFRISGAIQRDYARRRAFPALRYGRALRRYADGSATYAVTAAAAAELLNDAAEWLPTCKGVVAEAYRAHQARCWAAIATLQAAELALSSPKAVPLEDGPDLEAWAGTRDTLRELGAVHPGPWPGEPGGPAWRLEWRGADGRVGSIIRLAPSVRGVFKLLRFWPAARGLLNSEASHPRPDCQPRPWRAVVVDPNRPQEVAAARALAAVLCAAGVLQRVFTSIDEAQAWDSEQALLWKREREWRNRWRP